jgi:hypothetical protein
MISVGVPHEARQTFDFNVYEVRSHSPRKAKEAISAEHDFVAVNLFGNSVHILTLPDVETERVRDIVEAAGFERASVSKISPTFEDIYIGLSTSGK